MFYVKLGIALAVGIVLGSRCREPKAPTTEVLAVSLDSAAFDEASWGANVHHRPMTPVLVKIGDETILTRSRDEGKRHLAVFGRVNEQALSVVFEDQE